VTHDHSISSVHDLLQTNAELRPSAIAVTAPGRTGLTYEALFRQAHETGHALAEMGLGGGDCVAMALPNGPEIAVAFLAVAAGAVSAPLNPAYSELEFGSLLSQLGARGLILEAESDSPARAVAKALGVKVIELLRLPEAAAGRFTLRGDGPSRAARDPGFGGPEDCALLLSTSGTTSAPKIVPHTHRAMCTGAHNIAASLELTPSDRCLNVMPLYHGAGLCASVLGSMIRGGSIACCPKFDASKFFEWLDTLCPTWYGAVPAIHRAVLAEAAARDRPVSRGSLRLIRSGSAKLPADVRSQLERVFEVPVVEAYALSEAFQLASTPLGDEAGRAGRLKVNRGIQVAIADETGTILSPGQVGEIVCRGPAVFGGYASDTAENERAFVNGWFRTGDQGRLDGEGNLVVSGRLKEVINCGGEKISPQEVDEIMLSHPAIAEAAAFALPDVELGETVAAVVALRSGASATGSDLRKFAATRLAEFKVPRHVLIVPKIPTGSTGKVQRLSLARQLGLLQADSARRSVSVRRDCIPPRDMLEERLARIWEHVFGIRPIGITDDFFELGGHSLLAARMMDEIERESGRRLPPSALLEAPTVAQLAHAVLAEVARRPFLKIRAGSRPPLIFLNGDLHGGGFYCVKLAARLGAEQPFYAIASHGIDGEPIPPSIEAMAADHLEKLRAAQLQGPYLLGGFSHAALVAFEMARQLEARGEKVPLLFLVDIPADPRLRRFGAVRLRRAVVRVRTRLTRLRQRLSGLEPPPLQAGGLTRGQRLFAKYLPITRRYVPQPYGGRVTLVTATAGTGVGAIDPTLGWGRVAADVKVLSVPGDHMSCLTEHVAILGDQLRASLEAAHA
jgi:oxalate---CoA ligase